MGINPTPTNFKTFTFDGENSANFGVYITGKGVFNAPERNVEMIDIHGRNGAFALDHGNFNNIEVTYPAGIFADTEADFAQAVSDLRNWLCSKVGYVRLEDDYNPNEYRMAIYKSGLDVDHDMLIAGEFELTFDCKPQRFLKSGETAISITSGDTIKNPTRFDSNPMFEVYGYGNINSGDAEIDVQIDFLGMVTLIDFSTNATENKRFTTSYDATTIYGDYTETLDTALIATGDPIIASGRIFIECWPKADQYDAVISVTNSGMINGAEYYPNRSSGHQGYYQCIGYVYFADETFTAGTSSTVTGTSSVDLMTTDGTTTIVVTLSIDYDGADELLYHLTIVTDGAKAKPYVDSRTLPSINKELIRVDSTVPASAQPTYIDMDTGEAYGEINGVVVSLNDHVSLPSDLVKLPSGATEITYDNTITQLDIIPRWWKV